MIQPFDIDGFLQSEITKTAEALLDDVNIKVLNQKDLILARDYLMFRLIQANGQRPGPVKNLMIKNIDNAQITDEGVVVMVCTNLIKIRSLTLLLFIYISRVGDLTQACRHRILVI